MARAIAAPGMPQASEAFAAFDERLRRQGIAIDRILGLHDGAFAFFEPGFAQAVMACPGCAKG